MRRIRNFIGLPSVALLITAVFVIAKLMGLIGWSWWIVFAPVLITAGIFAMTAICVLSFLLGVMLYARFRHGRP